MQAGKLRERLTLQRADTDQNRAGEEVAIWEDLAERWGAVETLGGRELAKAQQVVAEATTKVTLRYDSTTSTLSVMDRIAHGDRTLEINHVADPDGRRRCMICLCREAAS